MLTTSVIGELNPWTALVIPIRWSWAASQRTVQAPRQSELGGNAQELGGIAQELGGKAVVTPHQRGTRHQRITPHR